MRDSLSSKMLTYGFLALFVFMVAVPLFWMLTTAIKTNKELYEDFSYSRAISHWRTSSG
jgi:ABC-type glycerol-3-phosphate transport system permease component